MKWWTKAVWVAVPVLLTFSVVMADKADGEKKGQEAKDPNGQSVYSVLDLVPPVKLDNRVDYDDGGTKGYLCTDSKGKAFKFCMDKRLATQPPYPFYLNATHPKQTNAVPVKVGSKLDSSIIELLHSLGEQTDLKPRS